MIYYYSVAAILTFFSVLETFLNSTFFRPIVIFYSFLLLFVFAGLRYDQFTDYIPYISIYNDAYSLGDLWKYGGYAGGIHGEYLFLLLNSLVKSVTGNPTHVFVIMALLAVGINLYCYEKYSPFVSISVLLYFSHIYLYKELIQIRAGLGGALVLLSALFIQKQQLWRFILTIVTATLFHTGAIIALPIYWLCRIRFSRIWLALPIFLGLVMAQIHWLDHFLGLLDNVGLLLRGIKTYRGVETLDYALGIFNPMTIKQILVSLIAIYYKDVLSARLRYFYPLLLMYILSTAWILAFNEFAILAARVATFLSVGDVVLIPALALLFKEKKFILLANVIFAWTILYLNLDGKKMWPPYEFIFFQ